MPLNSSNQTLSMELYTEILETLSEIYDKEPESSELQSDRLFLESLLEDHAPISDHYLRGNIRYLKTFLKNLS